MAMRAWQGFAHKHQRARFYRRQLRIAICRSSDELRRRFMKFREVHPLGRNEWYIGRESSLIE